MKYETVCITRCGLSFLHTEGCDFAAKVTYQSWTPGVAQNRSDVKQEMLIPIYGRWE